MRSGLSVILAFLVSTSMLFLTQGGVADAAFHCMRIHAVAGGALGNSAIQYVELRLDMPGHNLVGGHSLQFFDASGVLKATFTFPSNVTNGLAGDSVLIATSEFNAAATGGASDFTFTGANTIGANGGDPLHPVQPSGGSVVFAGTTTVCFTVMPPPVDAVAYGSATAIYGTAAVALPNPGNGQSLRLSNLAGAPTNNSTEYALQSIATSTLAVAPANLATDFTSPRNNARNVLKLTVTSPSVGGVAVQPDASATSDATTQSSSGSDNWPMYAGAGLAAAVIAGGAGWYVYRRRIAR